jgi:hypothetical protein
MRSALGRPAALLFAAICAACVACAGSRAAGDGSRTNREIITSEQILEYRFANAYEAVQALRSNWLQTKGVDSFRNPGQVRVYVDDTFLGGVETLRTIAVSTIYVIRHLDGVAATARWGVDHGQGVILVMTHR